MKPGGSGDASGGSGGSSAGGAGGGVGGDGGSSGGNAGSLGASGSGAAAGADGGVDAPDLPCDPTKPFDSPVLIPNVNSPESESMPRISADGLTLYIGSARPDGVQSDLYQATRDTTADAFGTPTLLAGLDTSLYEDSPTISEDGREIFFSRGPLFASDLHVSTRSSLAGDFQAASPISVLNSTGADDLVFLVRGGKRLYFTSNRNNNDWSLYRADRNQAGTFAAPEPLAEINTQDGSQDTAPFVTADDRTLYFCSTRGGSFDIWVAERKSTANDFGQPSPVTELNTSGHERPGSLSADGCTIYFEREGGGGPGKIDLWQATRPR